MACFLVKGFIPASVVWDIAGFADGLTAVREVRHVKEKTF
jgi:hypothetical protein